MKQLYEMYDDYGKGILTWLFLDLFFYILTIVFVFTTIYFIKSLPSKGWEVFFFFSYLGVGLYNFVMIMLKIEDIYKIIVKPESLI